MARLILEISGPRLGSTNFRRVMERFDTVEALDEFFNPNQPLPTALLERVSRAAADRGHDVPVDRKRMTAFALEDPVRAVEIALDASASAGKTHPVLKLAPGHLSA